MALSEIQTNLFVNEKEKTKNETIVLKKIVYKIKTLVVFLTLLTIVTNKLRFLGLKKCEIKLLRFLKQLPSFGTAS